MSFSFFSFPFFPIASIIFLGFILYLIFSPSFKSSKSRSDHNRRRANSGLHRHLQDFTATLQGTLNPKLPLKLKSGSGSNLNHDRDHDAESRNLITKINSSSSKYSSKSRVNFFLTGKAENSSEEINDKPPLILIVDDSRTALLTAKQALTNTPYRIATALGGNIAWEKMLLERPSLVITDYDMPNLNGMQLLQRMREDLRFLDVPVLMVSVNPFSQIEAGRQYQVNGFLAKPYKDQDLKEQIGYFLHSSATYH